jgi:hypothetical protein
MRAPARWVDRALFHALHGVARLALAVQSPLGARRTLTRVGSRMRPFESTTEARDAARSLIGHGSCLSRSMAVSARLPGSQVAIAVDARGSARFSAHAWVELSGERVDEPPPAFTDEAIARF